jgi:hypothetical protein
LRLGVSTTQIRFLRDPPIPGLSAPVFVLP